MRAVLIAVLLGVVAQPARAQGPTDSALVQALRLATEGQGDSARVLARFRLGELSPLDSLYPQALFVAGLVAADADEAVATFRRVAIEYSQSAWADQALLRVAQLRFAAGDYATAGRSAERVLLDYPFSPVRAAAAFWTARVRIELGDLPSACGYLRLAVDEAGEDVELANRARFYLQRCTSVEAGDSTTAADSAAPAGAIAYAVQVAAVATAAAADEVMQALRRAGFTPHVVREADGLFKVRVGRYAERARAQQVLAGIRRAIGGSPFVVEER